VREITDEQLDQILGQGADKAREIATVTLEQVFQKTGLSTDNTD
jgi:hypothetical protein